MKRLIHLNEFEVELKEKTIKNGPPQSLIIAAQVFMSLSTVPKYSYNFLSLADQYPVLSSYCRIDDFSPNGSHDMLCVERANGIESLLALR